MLLKDKTVLVTGASRGIGRETALECARQGAHIAINVFNDDDMAQSLKQEIVALGRQCIIFDGDVADAKTARGFIDAAAKGLGGIDVLVSNAGICPFHALLDMPEAILRRTIDVNLTGAYFMVQACANQMVSQGKGGAIIAISSISALVGGGMQTHYTPTKAGVHSLMQSAAIALGPHKIRCNSVMPGTIATDINKDDLADEAKRTYMESRIPLGRLGAPIDIARVVVFLASDMASYMTGASVLVDGGAFVNLQ